MECVKIAYSHTHLHIEHQLLHNCNSTADNEVSFVDSPLGTAQNQNSRIVHIQMKDCYILESSYYCRTESLHVINIKTIKGYIP